MSRRNEAVDMLRIRGRTDCYGAKTRLPSIGRHDATTIRDAPQIGGRPRGAAMLQAE